jgi:hypothetical protein
MRAHRPEMTKACLDAGTARLYSRAMINATTKFIARRRRTIAVRAVVCA